MTDNFNQYNKIAINRSKQPVLIIGIVNKNVAKNKFGKHGVPN